MEKLMLPVVRLWTYVFLATGFLFIVSPTSAQDISKTNLAHIYDLKAEVRIRYNVVSDPPGTIIFLQVITDNTADFMDDYTVGYQVKSNYDNQQPPFALLTDQNLLVKGETLIFEIAIPVTSEEMLCVLKITNTGTRRDFYFDIPVRNQSSFDNTRFYLKHADTDLPVIKPYLPSGSLVRFASAQTVDKIYGFKYSVDFEAALPPMATSAVAGNKSMTIDSAFQIDIDQAFTLVQEGLYFFQEDTTSLEGISMRVTNRYFPRLARVEDLIEPIVYLSTRLEYKSLINAADEKKAMDSYWLKIAGSKDKARRIIRNYYRNVESANKLFTNYKPGWKTDKGMVYIIYGQPEEVYKNEYEEIWVYERKENMSRIRFTFAKVKSIFAKNHYELRRERSYEKFWYRTIDLWRKGRKGI